MAVATRFTTSRLTKHSNAGRQGIGPGLGGRVGVGVGVGWGKGRRMMRREAKYWCTYAGRHIHRSMQAGVGGGEAYSFVACLSHMTIDHAFLSRRITVPTPNRYISNVWGLITFFRYMT